MQIVTRLAWLVRRTIYEIKTTINIIRLICGFVDAEDLPKYEPPLPPKNIKRESINATNWSAVFKTEDNGIIEYPLVAWDITYCNGEPIESLGVVFIGNKPPFVEYANASPTFIGYKHETLINSDFHGSDHSLISTAYEEFGEWS